MIETLGRPRFMLALEGAALLLISLLLYELHGGGWLLFILLLVAPDLSMLGYLGGSEVGAGDLWNGCILLYSGLFVLLRGDFPSGWSSGRLFWRLYSSYGRGCCASPFWRCLIS